VGVLTGGWLARPGLEIHRGDLTARSITIVDSAGHPRAHFGAAKGEVEIALLSPEGEPVLRLATSETPEHDPSLRAETLLELYGTDGASALALTIEPSRFEPASTPVLRLLKHGVVVAQLGSEGLDAPCTSGGGEDEGESSFQEFGFGGTAPVRRYVVRSTSHGDYRSRRTTTKPVEAPLGRQDNPDRSR
jgi:hypothetical protein